MHHMDLFPVDTPVTPAVAELIRTGVRAVLDAPPEWIAELNSAATSGAGMEGVAGDSPLLEVALRINAGNLSHWAAVNMVEPGARVPVAITEEARAYIRDLARRGFDSRALDSFRTAQNVAWRLWMQICFGLTDDPELLRELLEVTSTSIARFIDDTVRELAELIETARAELAADTHAQRRAAVALVLEGAPITAERAESQLRYRLDGPHTALVLVGDPGTPPEDLEATCESIMEASGVTRRLVVISGASELWVWLPTATVAADDAVSAHPGVRVAIGSAGEARDGFRTSHFQALTVRRLLGRPRSSRRVARYEQVRLVALLGEDRAAADEFVTSTLGELKGADVQVLECVRAWFAAGCRVSETAAVLYTHRNTVLRRLARADALLPVPVRENPVHVAVALELLDWIV
ncbi:helix-turn-helix domain-containing protein [Gordonia sp. HY366]|uniref:Helix-turn-helix domain-containing protein n=2 Tax=Gordonia liuliyuniae TaxID=2911517 RepID=A0ABS9IXK6_9ACTN|nr:helix-turn-helix domain-containing protein [Gordonia liuliyuniae]